MSIDCTQDNAKRRLQRDRAYTSLRGQAAVVRPDRFLTVALRQARRKQSAPPQDGNRDPDTPLPKQKSTQTDGRMRA